MNKQNLTYGQIIKVLETLGFQLVRVGSHLIYRHNKLNSQIIIKHGRKNENVPLFLYSAIRKNIVENGIAADSELDKLIKTR